MQMMWYILEPLLKKISGSFWFETYWMVLYHRFIKPSKPKLLVNEKPHSKYNIWKLKSLEYAGEGIILVL